MKQQLPQYNDCLLSFQQPKESHEHALPSNYWEKRTPSKTTLKAQGYLTMLKQWLVNNVNNATNNNNNNTTNQHNMTKIKQEQYQEQHDSCEK